MNILILCPTVQELKLTRKAIPNSFPHNISVRLIGVGKALAAASTALEVMSSSSPRYDLVVLTGFAAGHASLHVNDIVVPSSCSYHDSNYYTNPYPLQGKSQIPCLTGDTFVTSELSENPCIYDMEAAAVAQILEMCDVPLLLFKYISDIPSSGASSLLEFEKFADSHAPFHELFEYLLTIPVVS